MKKFNINLKDRKTLSMVLCLILVCVFTLTIAYAALSVTLNIVGNAEVVASSWDIKLSNPKVKNGSATIDVPTINGNTLTFNTTLTTPGDFYEFTVDVVNSGTIDAMIGSITKNPELTNEQLRYLRYDVSYQNGESITSKQLLAKNSSMPIKVRIEFRNDILPSDLPSGEVTLNLSITLNYVQSDGNTIGVSNNGIEPIRPVAEGSLDAVGTIVTIDDQQFYTIGTDGNNVKLLSMYNLHVGNRVDTNYETSLLANSTGIQSSLAKGWDWNDDSSSEIFPFIGTTAFSESSSTYSGSLVEGYVNNYKNILQLDYGLEIVEARLITMEELTSSDIGCNVENLTCADAPDFIYATSYWINYAYNSNYVGNVYSDGEFSRTGYTHDDVHGVRPVIVISKDLF